MTAGVRWTGAVPQQGAGAAAPQQPPGDASPLQDWRVWQRWPPTKGLAPRPLRSNLYILARQALYLHNMYYKHDFLILFCLSVLCRLYIGNVIFLLQTIIIIASSSFIARHSRNIIILKFYTSRDYNHRE